MRSVLAAGGLLLVFAFSGCSTGGDGGDTDDLGGGTATTGGTTGRPSDPGSPGDADTDNTPPTARIDVVVPPSGGDVNFTVDGRDADGDSLTWILSLGDGSPNFSGTVLPSKVNHTFEPGDYFANLTVNDGQESTSVGVTVSVAPSAPVQTVDGTYVAGFEGCAAMAYDQAGIDAGGPAGGATNGLTRVQFAVEPLSIGLAYTAVFEFDVGYLYVSVDFFGNGGTLLSSDNTGQSPNFGGVTMEGTVPDGAVTGVLFACGGPTSSTVHYEARP